MKYQNFIETSLTQAAEIARNNFGQVSSTVKPDDNNQVLTATDVEIGHLLVEKIKSEFPSHNIIDEEAGVIDNQSQFTWVVDPIDGTSNFANGIPAYGILLGLLSDDQPIAGGLALPSFQDLYIAEKGEGTCLNGNRVFASQEKSLLNALVAYGIDGHQEDPSLTEQECQILAQIILGIRNLRTSNSAYDFALVADGRYGAFLNRTSKIWDNVAAQVIITEAGGVYTDFAGQPIDYSHPLEKADQNFEYIAAAPHLHGQIMKVLRGIS